MISPDAPRTQAGIVRRAKCQAKIAVVFPLSLYQRCIGWFAVCFHLIGNRSYFEGSFNMSLSSYSGHVNYVTINTRSEFIKKGSIFILVSISYRRSDLRGRIQQHVGRDEEVTADYIKTFINWLLFCEKLTFNLL